MSTATRGRQILMFVLVAVVSMFAWTPAASADQSKPSVITLAAAIDGNKNLTASGVLTAFNNQPIRGADVAISIDRYPAATAKTDASGRYSVSLSFPSDTPGDHTVEVAYAGDHQRFGPATSSATVTLAAAAAGTMTLSVTPDRASQSMLLTLSGTLLGPDKKPVPNVLITFYAGTQLVRDSTTPTFADGTFATYLTVPDSFPGGSLTIRARFAGSPAVGATEASGSVTVLVEPSESPTPSASPSASESASPSASVSASPSATASSSAIVAASRGDTSSGSTVPWLLLGFVVIALFGVLVTAGLVYRERVGGPPSDESGGVLEGFTPSE